MREEFVVKRHRAIGAAALGLLLAVTAFPAFAVPGQDPPREALVKRLSAEAPSARLLVPLTGLLLDYVESVIPAAKLSDLFASENAAEFLRRLRFVTGKDLLDIGADMFGHYEKKAPPDPGGAWTKIPAGPFRLYIRPGSAADRDRDLIARDVIETAARVAEGLDLCAPCSSTTRARRAPGPG
jgi:hypothetical protein